MIDCYRSHGTLSMAERLLRCLQAAELKGGDRRGRESAALRVFDPKYPQIKQFLPDLRVDNHERPYEELERLYQCYLEKDRSVTPFDD